MSAITDKYNCGNCDFWLEDPTLTPTGGPLLTMHDSGAKRAMRLGHCRKDPPSMVMVPVPHPMDPRQVQMRLQRHYPITQPDEFCSHHPILKADTLRGMAAMAVQAYLRDVLDYKPGTYPDQNAAGFNRIPTLEEAKTLALGAKEKPDIGDRIGPDVVKDFS